MLGNIRNKYWDGCRIANVVAWCLRFSLGRHCKLVCVLCLCCFSFVAWVPTWIQRHVDKLDWWWLLSWDTFVFWGLACGVLSVSFESWLQNMDWLEFNCRLRVGFIRCLLKTAFLQKPVKKLKIRIFLEFYSRQVIRVGCRFNLCGVREIPNGNAG